MWPEIAITPNLANPQDPPALEPQDAVRVPTWRAAYSDRTAAMMASFSQLAYVPFLDAQPPRQAGAPKQEKPGGPAELEACLKVGKFRLVARFNKADVQAFLAVDDQQFAVLAFRGTANWGDWKINLNAVRVPLPGFPGVRVHKGFWDAFECSHADILAALTKYVPDSLGLYITGHSLGGALAQIAAAVFERDNLAACYTYGSPRVATLAFDTDVKCPHYRLVNAWDLVPGVPWPTPWGYHHTGDPRLLIGPSPVEALRRDREFFPRVLVDVLAGVRWAFTHDFSAVDDHMIWNYRTKLEKIAQLRAPAPPTPPAPSAPPKRKRAPRKPKAAA